MTKHRKKHSKHTKSRRSNSPFGFMALIAAALVALTALANQQGIVKWELPASVAAALNVQTDTQPAADQATPAVTLASASVDMGLGSTPGASNDNCPVHFLDSKPPVLTNDKMAAKTSKLCYQGFAVLNSGLTRTPLWAAEHLTPARVAAARGLPRKGSFHADRNLPEDHRAELDDYKGFGFDRGHMAPNGDMPDEGSQAESFTLANMVPQNADNNRGIWRQIEENVRELAEASTDVFVVSGPIYDGDEIETINGRVMVPTGFFKAVYDAKKRQGAAYVVRNAEGSEYETISLTELQGRIGMQVFPGLPLETTGELELPALSGKRHS